MKQVETEISDELLIEIYEILIHEKKLSELVLPITELEREDNIISYTLPRIGIYQIDMDEYRKTGQHIHGKGRKFRGDEL